ncbi:MAG: hypothetical protein R3C11_26690 [Planctomycetaceae bacterium]
MAILQLNAICIFCSASSGNAISALVLSVVSIIGFFFLPLLLAFVMRYSFMSYTSYGWTSSELVQTSAYLVHPPILNAIVYEGDLYRLPLGWSTSSNTLLVLTASIPIWISIAVFLVLARVMLVRKALSKTRNIVYAFFIKLDRLFNSWNSEVAGGIVLIKDRADLPTVDPIAWKETRKSAIGTARYLIRILVVLELPTLFLALFLMMEGVRNKMIFFPFILFLLAVAVLMLVNKATGLIAQERAQQTLDVILTTPISGEEIILQKARGIRKLWITLLIPLMTVILAKTLIIPYEPLFKIYYLLLATGFVVSITYFSIWLSMFVGLRQKRHLYNIMITMSLLAAWCFSYSLLQFLQVIYTPTPPYSYLLMMLSPLWILRVIDGYEAIEPEFQTFAVIIVLGFLAYTMALAWILRKICLDQADRTLGRLSDSRKSTSPTFSAKKQENPAPA